MRQDRFTRIESGLLWDDNAGCTRHEATMNMAQTFEQKAKDLQMLYRVQAQAERSFYKAYNTLEARKRERVFARPVPEEIQIEANLCHEPRKLQNKPIPVAMSELPKLRNEPTPAPEQPFSTHDNPENVIEFQNKPRQFEPGLKDR